MNFMKIQYLILLLLGPCKTLFLTNAISNGGIAC